MKAKPQCPLRGSQAEVVDATPCWECGSRQDHIEILRQDMEERFQHDSITYSLYRFPGDVEVSLCHGCAIDTGSYLPAHWGPSISPRIGYERLQFLEDVTARGVQKTKWCNTCGWSLNYSYASLAIRDALKDGKA